MLATPYHQLDMIVTDC